MKWILVVMFSTSGGPGIAPMSITMEFGDVRACEKAVPRLDDLTKRYRVIGSKMDWVCLPAEAPL